jgi:hypothetical protein
METIFNIATGLIIIFLLGLGVGPLIRCVQRSVTLEPPDEEHKDKWIKLTEGNEGGAMLGNLERLLFFGALWKGMPLLVGAWLAFKVASKWNVWSNIISVPKEISGVDPIGYLNARRRWGSQLLSTFLVGTLANVIIAYIGVALACNSYAYFHSLFH